MRIMIQVMGVFTDGQLAQTGSDESHPFGHIPGDPDLADRIQLLAKRSARSIRPSSGSHFSSRRNQR